MKNTVDLIQSIAIVLLGVAGMVTTLRGNHNEKK